MKLNGEPWTRHCLRSSADIKMSKLITITDKRSNVYTGFFKFLKLLYVKFLKVKSNLRILDDIM